MDVRLPNLGEGVDSGSVVNIFVKEGDVIAKGQTILELENEKAVAPIPSPAEGRITGIRVKPGDKITVGQVLLSLSTEAGSAAAPPSSAKPAKVKPSEPAKAAPQVEASSPPPTGENGEPASEELPSYPAGVPPPAAPSIRR